jgi:Cys-tRNA(Pro)/Cys-tRNA(Cys) deacylase
MAHGADAAKTNAARLLEARGIGHRVRVYDPDGAFHSADEAAGLLGAPSRAVLKTLVVLRERAGRTKPLLVLVPSDRQVDLKRLGQALGDKVGGISALAVRAGVFEVLVDRSAADLPQVHVSAGARGVDLELALSDLLLVTGGRLVHASGGALAGPDALDGSEGKEGEG